METLIKNAKIIFPGHDLINEYADVYIKEGIVRDIGKNLKYSNATEIAHDHLCISPGWLDYGTQLGEPGMEQRETFQSLTRAAQQGGYVGICPFSNSNVPPDTRTSVDFLRSQSRNLPIDIFPIGAISKRYEGKQLAEMLDIFQYGAVGFSDGLRHLFSASLLLKALQYSNKTGKYVAHCPGLLDLHGNAQIHESELSMMMGMPGFPRISEEIILERDLGLCSYTGSHLLSHLITIKESVGKIAAAKSAGIKVKSSVSSLHLYMNNMQLEGFDTSSKVLPVLREEVDRQSLIAGIKKGVIDIISSNHVPLEPEAKDLEFPLSEFGSTGIVSCFGAIRKATHKTVPLEILIAAISTNVYALLGIDSPNLEIGEPASFTMFDSETEWTYQSSHNQSLSKNAALLNQPLKGRAIGSIHKNKVKLNEW